MIICLFTGLLTPLGTTPYKYLVKTMQGNTTQNINEHLIMDLISQYTKIKLEDIMKKITSAIGIISISIIMLGFSYYMAKDKINDSYLKKDYQKQLKDTYQKNCLNVLKEFIDLGQARFYNEYNYGSYMLYRGIPVFIDSRVDLYAPEFSGKQDDIFMDFIETSNISKFYEDTFEKYKITHVITYKNSKMNMIITKTNDKKYKELYSDKYFVVYERITE